MERPAELPEIVADLARGTESVFHECFSGAQDDRAVLNVSSMTSESVNTLARLTNVTCW